MSRYPERFHKCLQICKNSNMESDRYFYEKNIIWILTMLMIGVIAIFGIELMIVGYNHFWKYSADYENFANDFDLVKNYITEAFPDKSDKWLSVSNDGNGEVRLFDPETKSYLILPSDVVSSLTSIRNNAFPDKDSVFSTIRIHENRISFCISNGKYALVYSPDQKPSWVNSPSENSKVKVKSIQGGWYHVTKN